MLPTSIYITEDFGASSFPDANGNFRMISTIAPAFHIQVEENFRENPKVPSMSSNRQLQTPSFGAFKRNDLLSSSTNDTRRRSAGNEVYSFKIVQPKMVNKKISKEGFYAKNVKTRWWFLQLGTQNMFVFMSDMFDKYRIVNSCLIV